MKTINVILSSIVALSMVMGSATIGFNKTVAEANGSNVSLAIESQEDVYGLQFEIKYNTDEIILNNITSKVDGFTFEYREKEDGLVKGLLFSLQGIAISNSNALISWATELPDPVGIIPILKLWRLFESLRPFTTSLIVPSPPKIMIFWKAFLLIFET